MSGAKSVTTPLSTTSGFNPGGSTGLAMRTAAESGAAERPDTDGAHAPRKRAQPSATALLRTVALRANVRPASPNRVT